MRFNDIDFVTVSSNNHASPTGALPFLLPASQSKDPGEAVLPVPSTRIERWIRERNTRNKAKSGSLAGGLKDSSQHAEASASTKRDLTSKESSDMRHEAYMSLLNYKIRNAYVGLTSVPHSIVE